MPTTKSSSVQSTESGYHNVTFGDAEVTVRNDGMITLPQLVPPHQVQDLAGALIAAQPVAEQQQAENEAAQEAAQTFFDRQREEATAVQEAVREAANQEQKRLAKAPARRATKPAEPTVQRRKSGGPRGAARPTQATPPVKKAAAKAPAKKVAGEASAAKKAPAKAAPKRNRAAQKRAEP